jgi:hypothetical protein
VITVLNSSSGFLQGCVRYSRVVILLTSNFIIGTGYAVFQVAGAASLQGTVTNATGALIPNADITLTDDATHIVRTAKSDASGCDKLFFFGDYQDLRAAQASNATIACVSTAANLWGDLNNLEDRWARVGASNRRLRSTSL